MNNASKERTYVGIYNDQFGGMTALGGLVKDAWIFSLLPETQTCEGWTHGAMEALGEKVQREWQKYGYHVNDLPEAIRQIHTRVHTEAITRARRQGWDPDSEIGEE